MRLGPVQYATEFEPGVNYDMPPILGIAVEKVSKGQLLRLDSDETVLAPWAIRGGLAHSLPWGHVFALRGIREGDDE